MVPKRDDSVDVAGATSREAVADLIAARISTLTQSGRRVARALTADYPSAGLGTVASLAEAAGVSAPTVTRFAAALGFADYGALQARLKDELRLRREGPLASLEWSPQPGSASELLVQRAEVMAGNVLQSMKAIPDADLQASIDLLADTSRRVLISGGRYTASLARHLTNLLETVRPRVHFIADPFGLDISTTISLGRRDLYVLFDFRRHQRDLVDLSRHVRRSGAKSILFTDSGLSPAATQARAVLPVDVEAPSPFHTFSAGIVLVELIVVAVVHQLGDDAVERMAAWDRFRTRELIPGDDAEL